MDNIKTSESGIFQMAKNTLNKQSASKLILKLNKHFVGSGCELLAEKKDIIDIQNRKEIEEERRSYLFRVKLAINYYDAHFTQQQIRSVRNAANSEVVVDSKGTYLYMHFVCNLPAFLKQLYEYFFLERVEEEKVNGNVDILRIH